MDPEDDGGRMSRVPHGTYQYVPTAGVRSDLKQLMDTYLSMKSVRFDQFVEVWRNKMMTFIFACRATDREAREFAEQLFMIVIEYFLPPFQFQVRVGGLYLLYSLYQTQPLIPRVKIRLTKSQWEESQHLIHQASQQNHLDVVYIFQRLIHEHAFHFCQTANEMSYRNNCTDPSDDAVGLADQLKEEKSALNRLFNYESMEQLSYLQSQYQQMKVGLAGPAATKPDKSLDVLHGELVEDLIVVLQNFREKTSDIYKFGKQGGNMKKEVVETSDPKVSEADTGSRRQALKQRAFEGTKSLRKNRNKRFKFDGDSDVEENKSPRKSPRIKAKPIQSEDHSHSESDDYPNPPVDISSADDSEDEYIPPGQKLRSPIVNAGKYGKRNNKTVVRVPINSDKIFSRNDRSEWNSPIVLKAADAKQFERVRPKRGRPKKCKAYDHTDDLKKAYIEKRRKEGASINLDDSDSSSDHLPDLNNSIQDSSALVENGLNELQRNQRESITSDDSDGSLSDMRNLDNPSRKNVQRGPHQSTKESAPSVHVKFPDHQKRGRSRSASSSSGEDGQTDKFPVKTTKRRWRTRVQKQPNVTVEMVYPKGKVINPNPSVRGRKVFNDVTPNEIMKGVERTYLDRSRIPKKSKYEVVFGHTYAGSLKKDPKEKPSAVPENKHSADVNGNVTQDSCESNDTSLRLKLTTGEHRHKGKGKKSKAFAECLSQSKILSEPCDERHTDGLISLNSGSEDSDRNVSIISKQGESLPINAVKVGTFNLSANRQPLTSHENSLTLPTPHLQVAEPDGVTPKTKYLPRNPDLIQKIIVKKPSQAPLDLTEISSLLKSMSTSNVNVVPKGTLFKIPKPNPVPVKVDQEKKKPVKKAQQKKQKPVKEVKQEDITGFDLLFQDNSLYDKMGMHDCKTIDLDSLELPVDACDLQPKVLHVPLPSSKRKVKDACDPQPKVVRVPLPSSKRKVKDACDLQSTVVRVPLPSTKGKILPNNVFNDQGKSKGDKTKYVYL